MHGQEHLIGEVLVSPSCVNALKSEFNRRLNCHAFRMLGMIVVKYEMGAK